MSNKYVFVLGRTWELSQAELHGVFGEDGYFELESREAVVVDCKDEIKRPKLFFDKLGGVVKMGEVFAEVKELDEVDGAVADFLVAEGEKFDKGNSGKFLFGVSLYSFSQKHEDFLKKYLKKWKKDLREVGVSSRFVNRPWKSVNDVAVLKEGLIEKGASVMVLETAGGYLCARTVAVQDVDAYSKRDFDKPRRNPKRGMLPPKLAQVMINVSGVVGDSTTEGGNFMDMSRFMGKESPARGVIYDPFCGNGTVLMEAMLMGFDVIGSDISYHAVEDSIANLEWLQKEFSKAVGRRFFVFERDVMDLTKSDVAGALGKMHGVEQELAVDRVSAIVTESYLGPPMTKFPDEDRRRQVDSELAGMLEGGFRNFKEIFGEGVPVVVTLPVYRNGRDYFPLEKSVEKIKGVGYSAFALLENRRSLIYDRPDQVVGRELYRFEN